MVRFWCVGEKTGTVKSGNFGQFWFYFNLTKSHFIEWKFELKIRVFEFSLRRKILHLNLSSVWWDLDEMNFWKSELELRASNVEWTMYGRMIFKFFSGSSRLMTNNFFLQIFLLRDSNPSKIVLRVCVYEIIARNWKY